MEKRQRVRKDPKEECGTKLSKLLPYITTNDRKLAMAEFDIAYITVYRYLYRKVANITLGLGLLQFFDKQVKDRNEELKKISSNYIRKTRK